MQLYPSRANLPEDNTLRVLLQGTGASVPTVVFGQKVTVSRPGAGRIAITWSSNPGYFLGFGYALRDTTQANVKNMSVTAGLYTNTNGVFTIEVDVWSSAGAATDLATTNFLDLEFNFKGTAG